MNVYVVKYYNSGWEIDRVFYEEDAAHKFVKNEMVEYPDATFNVEEWPVE